MAVRALTRLIPAVLLLAFAAAAPAQGCFGPKLYIGVAAEARQEMLFALVSLYVAEKTGVQSERVDLRGGDPGQALHGEQVDLAFAVAPPAGTEVVLAVAGYPLLASGSRPLTDLQFTTVVPALRKLAGLLTPRDLAELEARIRDGATPLAAARGLCQERRWL
ncbi:MAG: hypothetical protein FDZ69_04950 [Deltaproteobacteria bacterium]|nr:MAG: hypothetical protein FDZ69_04950 [Deltaproteobacteria bacterium]